MSTGAICVNTLKKDWTSETSFSHVLSVIRCLMIVPFPESSLNDEAGKLFMDSYDEYAKRARLMADIHGRPKACGDSPDEDKRVEEENDGAVRRSNSPLSSGGSSSNRSLKAVNRSGSGKPVHTKAGDKKSKKKSLRRL